MYHVFVQLPTITEYLYGTCKRMPKAQKWAKERYNFHNQFAHVTIQDDSGNILYKHWANNKEKINEK